MSLRCHKYKAPFVKVFVSDVDYLLILEFPIHIFDGLMRAAT